jgi:hypothetical protein
MALALLAAAPDSAMVGPWRVGPMNPISCQATASFGEHVAVSISEDATGTGGFVFGDDRWLLRDGSEMSGTISWDNWKNEREFNFVAVRLPSGRSVLAAETDSGFTENLAGAKRFWLRVPGIEFDDDFDIPNAGDVVTAIAECNSKL